MTRSDLGRGYVGAQTGRPRTDIDGERRASGFGDAGGQEGEFLALGVRGADDENLAHAVMRRKGASAPRSAFPPGAPV